MYVKGFIVNVNKCLKPFYLDQHINSVNTVTLQSFWFIYTCIKYHLPGLVYIFCLQRFSCIFESTVLFDFSLTVKAAPHECVIRTGQP